ncbi:Ger(x)C family spore germination protein [Paenibacillus nasutitermitis]|uniref:Spore germination protein YfkR n=1 Tax=Paenibacillus nasutitermitis TaxID=1652958 RepID=A0A917E1Q1_9BACL|nr:Ger(x)C family spore germination protein [Paenibacillus nasutitermitis]GGD93381.1 putative spore germination protein YfkR [Paenibacillus nasutitermitis]
MRRKAIRLPLLTIAVSICLSLTSGCWDRTEINDMAIVLAAGADAGEKGMVELTVQVYVPTSGSGASSSGEPGALNTSGAQTMVTTADGVSLADALSHLQERLSRKLFWGHSDVFVFGKKRAEAGIKEDLDFILRFVQMRERTDVYVTEGKAFDIMQLIPRLERSSMEALSELSKTQVSTEVDLRNIVQDMLETPEQTFFLPSVLSGDEISDKLHMHKTNKPYFSGLSIFKHGKMIGSVDNDISRGVFWLTNRIKASVITLTPKEVEGTVSVDLTSSRTTVHPHIDEKGKWHVVLSISGMGDVLQNTTSLDLMNPQDMLLVNRGANELIRSRVDRALAQVQKNMKADVLGIGKAFRKHYPKQWKQAKKNWEQVFHEVNIKTDINVRIVHTGIVSQNIDPLKSKEAK